MKISKIKDSMTRKFLSKYRKWKLVAFKKPFNANGWLVAFKKVVFSQELHGEVEGNPSKVVNDITIFEVSYNVHDR